MKHPRLERLEVLPNNSMQRTAVPRSTGRSAERRPGRNRRIAMRVHSWTSITASVALMVALSCWAVAVGVVSGQAPAAQRDATRFIEPPGQETDAMKQIIDKAKAALESGKSTTAILTGSSYLTAHEWPRFRKQIRDSAQPSPVTIVSEKEPGQALIVAGRVVDGRGQAVKAVVIYFYQTSDKGWYSDQAAHIGGMEGDRRHARLFGYLKTNDEGRFELRTIRPAGYPHSNLPAHIHVEVEGANSPAGSLITEIQFDDDPRLTAEWRERSQREGFVIARVTTDSENHQRVEVELKMR
ncbi:MAG: hypothetical protein IPJ07_17725 [Acidobacteria bacterium]|nr:hypothetical protein [Acidobacteriota bacterium]